MILKMCSFTYSFSFLFIIFVSVFYVPTVFSAPVKPEDNPYSKFIESLIKNNCTMPEKVKLPFPESNDKSHFDYFLNPLKACQTINTLKEINETALLCNEIFDVLRNITCFSGELNSEIDSGLLSKDVCNDYTAMKDILPKREDYLSGKLVDGVICKLLCLSDKYDLLCKTLLWSYETQAKIKNSIEKEVKIKDATEDQTAQKASSTIRISLSQNNSTSSKPLDDMKSDKSKCENGPDDSGKPANPSCNPNEEHSNDQALESNELGQAKISNDLPNKSEDLEHSEDEKSPDSQLKNQENTVSEIKPSGESHDTTQITKNNIISSTSKNQKEVTSSINNASRDEKLTVPAGKESKSVTQKGSIGVISSKDTKVIESNKISNQVSQDNPTNEQENAIDVDDKEVKPPKGNTQINTNDASNASGLTNNKDEISKDITNDESKDGASTDLSTKSSSKSEQPIPSENDETVNDLDSDNPPVQENESEVKQTDSKLPENKDDSEKPEQNELEVPNEIAGDVDSKLPESTTFPILPDDEAEPHQEVKLSDEYDPENEDYSKTEYENPPPKMQEPNIKSSSSAGSNPLSSNYEYRNTGNNIGRSSGDIPMIPAFPEQEDGHFFFYFLSIVLILMAGYLIFHNKQKIIALIVEGRHERRRRSGPGYRKLETK